MEIKTDTGETIVFVPLWDEEEDRKQRALQKAIEPIDRGYFSFLNHGARSYLAQRKAARVARFLETLYQAGFKGGLITLAEADALVNTLYKQSSKSTYRSMDMLVDFLDSQKANIEKMDMGGFFPEMPTIYINGQNWKKLAPRNHHKGKGSGKRDGRPEKVYFIPRSYVINALIGQEDQTFIALPVRALEKDSVYKAFVWKAPVIKNRKVVKKQVEMCEELNISRRTMKRYVFISGAKDVPYYEDHKLSSRRVAQLPKDRRQMREAIQDGELRFKSVHDENGMWSKANLQDIQAKNLEGHLYASIRTMTTFLDETFDAWVIHPESKQTAVSRLFQGAIELE